ncbi:MULTISPECIES: sulfatase-like hydrolase/transferase [Enterococcus]|uniref:Sulfatase N-terminal domain-containing protein n=1 Tax=Candidatus Enterococcus mangumiae TaxID=2230878 RepID=A0ABZ2SSK8_9ENTE|nr:MULTISPECIES: sulfatase-like hydrolase/transferase [unclassified Enterococcus]MBO0490965.1 sulfatase-like hydrolase/transferase [Enterococcus sp. DIV1094]MBO1300329.1 sulfatase-like hydrolase/transferase [Enterococcus sp. DIV1271a]
MSGKKNIFLFVADQMRNDSLAHMGNPASITPNLDDLVSEGVSFENAYCQNPVCVPSRNSFLTGLYPHVSGHRTMHYLQREDEPNILKEMKNNGYEVIWIGRNDVVPADRTKTEYCDEYYDGITNENMRDAENNQMNHSAEMNEESKKLYDKMLSGDTYYSFYMGKLPDGEGYGKTDWNCVEKALEYIERRSKESSDKPFFVYCTISFPHPPYACEDPWYSNIDRSKLPPRRPNIQEVPNKASMLYSINERQELNGWSEERFDELRGTYLAMVSRFDHQVGLIKEKLKKSGLYDDTNLIIYSDHGDYTGDYTITEKVQNCFEDPISNVPLLIKPAKGLVVEPRISKAQVELLDLPSTIAEMAEIDLSYTQFGKSLLHVVAGDEEHKDAVFCEGGRIHGERQAMELGHGPESPYWPRLSTQYSEGPEHTKAVMCKMGDFKYTMRLYETDELYNTAEDPMEINNLAVLDEYQELVQKMKNRVTQFYMETTDYVPMKRDKR